MTNVLLKIISKFHGACWAAALAAGLAAGCGDAKPGQGAAKPGAAKSSSPAVAAAPAAPSDAGKKEEFAKSVFMVRPDSRDPFFPSSSRFNHEPTQPTELKKGQEASPNAVASALQSGFQGVYRTATERVALVHNVMLEVDKETTVPMSVDGRDQRIKVRCLRILKGSVVLTVDGHAEPITLKLFAKR